MKSMMPLLSHPSIKSSRSVTLFSLFLLVWLSSLFCPSYATKCPEVPWKEVSKFKCVTDKEYCVEWYNVCNGVFDCEDHSDEWDSHCSQDCWDQYDEYGVYVPGFSCRDSAYPFEFNVSSDGDLQGGARDVGVYGRDFGTNHTAMNLSIGENCIPLNLFCNGYDDCGNGLDEKRCSCDVNFDCPEPTHAGPNLLRILAGIFGTVALFGFCFCAAIQWEKHRVGVLLSQRENHQRLTLDATRRRMPPTGQLNLGVTLDPTEFDERVRGMGGGGGMRPPSYSIATMEYPKPEPVIPSGDLPPPYQPEWAGSFQAGGETFGPVVVTSPVDSAAVATEYDAAITILEEALYPPYAPVIAGAANVDSVHP